jgi:CubicO group peptidase (beta-lactamase class C family)
MTTRKFLVLFAIVALSGCGNSPQTSTANGPKEQLTAETPKTTPAGTTFTAPKGWSISSGSSSVVLDAPEGDTHIAIVDAQGADAAAAVANAWSVYRPGATRPLLLTTPGPGRNGWDESQTFNYETSPNERARVRATALRAGTAWTVMILEASNQTGEKRTGQISLVGESLRPKGFVRETFAGHKANPLDAQRIEQMKRFVETSMKALSVPGASIALLDGGKVVYEGGLGVKELGKPAKVDENTLFMAASNTKGMTTLLLAILADENKLKWDQPVTQLYPPFKLGDADTTRQVLVEHLICACTGLPRQDFEWLFQFKHATPLTSLALLGTMQPTSHFGDLFQYSNLMAAAAGYVGAHVYDPKRELGAAYDDAMQKKIFTPLGMNSTTFSMERAIKGNHASPHGDDVDGNTKVTNMATNYSIVPHRPAGGVWTSSHDLARYVQMELALGKLPDGKRLVSEENLLIRRKPGVLIGEDQYYGMGLESDKTYGVTVIHHGGSLFGYKSDLMFLPDYGVGAVILTNSDNGGRLLHPMMRRLLEVVFDGKPEAAADIDAAAANEKASQAKDRQRLAVPADATEVAKLAKQYKNDPLGPITVTQDKDNTIFTFAEWKSPMASRKNDDGTVSFLPLEPSLGWFSLVAGTRDGKRVLVVRDGQHEYVFSEVS